MQKAQKEFGFSDREISLIRYSLTILLYEISKLFLYSFFFLITGKFIHFIFAIIPLLFLRCKNGGIHVKTYWGCFIFSFIYLYLCINILPKYIKLPTWCILLILIICTIINYMIGPVSLNRRAEKDMEYKQKAKKQTLIFTAMILISIFILPNTNLTVIPFWTLVLHTLQMVITPKLKEVKYREELG